MLYFHVNIEANTERRAVTPAELIYGVDEAGSETQHRRVLNSSMRYKRMLLLKSGLGITLSLLFFSIFPGETKFGFLITSFVAVMMIMPSLGQRIARRS